MFDDEIKDLLTEKGENGVVFETCDMIRINFKLERAEIVLKS